jgi:hypothetical protein
MIHKRVIHARFYLGYAPNGKLFKAIPILYFYHHQHGGQERFATPGCS